MEMTNMMMSSNEPCDEDDDIKHEKRTPLDGTLAANRLVYQITETPPIIIQCVNFITAR